MLEHVLLHAAQFSFGGLRAAQLMLTSSCSSTRAWERQETHSYACDHPHATVATIATAVATAVATSAVTTTFSTTTITSSSSASSSSS